MQTFSSAHIDPVNVRRQVELTYIQADNIQAANTDVSVLAWLNHHWRFEKNLVWYL